MDVEVARAPVSKGVANLEWGPLGSGGGWLGAHVLVVEPVPGDADLGSVNPIAVQVGGTASGAGVF